VGSDSDYASWLLRVTAAITKRKDKGQQYGTDETHASLIMAGPEKDSVMASAWSIC